MIILIRKIFNIITILIIGILLIYLLIKHLNNNIIYTCHIYSLF